MVEHLICAGAFDAMYGSRKQKYESVEHIMELAAEQKKSALTGQMGLFGGTNKENPDADDSYAYPTSGDWNNKEKLEREKEVIGFYLSAHPLESYRSYLQWFSIQSFDQLLKIGMAQVASATEVSVIGCGLIKSRKDIITKKGDRMTFLQVEDAQTAAEVIIFPRLFTTIESWLDNYNVFLIRGGLDLTSPNKCKIKAQDCIPLELLFEQGPSIERIRAQIESTISEEQLQQLSSQLVKGPTPLEFIILEQGKKIRVRTKQSIAVNEQTISALESCSMAIKLSI